MDSSSQNATLVNGQGSNSSGQTETNQSATNGSAPRLQRSRSASDLGNIGTAAPAARPAVGATNPNTETPVGGNPYIWVRPEIRPPGPIHSNWAQQTQAAAGQGSIPDRTAELQRTLELLVERSRNQEASFQTLMERTLNQETTFQTLIERTLQETNFQAQFARIREQLEGGPALNDPRTANCGRQNGPETSSLRQTHLNFSPSSVTPETGNQYQTPQGAGLHLGGSHQRAPILNGSSSQGASVRENEQLPPPIIFGSNQAPPPTTFGSNETPATVAPISNGAPASLSSSIEQKLDDIDQRNIERNALTFEHMKSYVHAATSSAPNIDLVIRETRRTPFTKKIGHVRLSDAGKIKFPEYSGNSDPRAHVRSFMLAITKAHLTAEEEEAGHCKFFVENLTGSALEWFSSLKRGSIDNFTQLVSVFLKQYSVFIETRATEADLWTLTQGQGEPLRSNIDRFKQIKAQIPNLNETVAL
ncbi:unnamed protein product [Microthlaspi erraticum]|uniref:Retrotransposon gag domain-containing protein n=1 Tax=Microthlaspi erraticum TaxID=1685480 RepID=A0A6D2K021_9BRAS|nr:unnamed protein product [Microthlaspi erraticum]